MRIALVAPVEEKVPPAKYGGTELIVAHLERGLSQRGHDVTLLASGDSQAVGTLVPLVERSIRSLDSAIEGKDREAWKYLALGETVSYLTSQRFDLIHQHVGWRVTPFERLFHTPSLTTLHGPLTESYVRRVFERFPHHNYVTISNAQRLPSPGLNYVKTIYNGIDLEQFTFNEQGGGYYAFLARMSPEKGPREAILAAKAAGVNLKIGAKVDATDRAYYEQEIVPLIDGTQIEFVGEVGPRERDHLLGNARGLLAPIQWEEPFGLFIVEAMATGTPVLAFARGSVPELIEDGRTGYIVNSSPSDVRGTWQVRETGFNGYVAAIVRLQQLDTVAYQLMRQESRSVMEQRFSLDRMVDEYEALYQTLLAS